MALLLGLVAPHALLMPSPARHTGPALRSRVAAAPTMTAFGQQSCQPPEVDGLRAGEIGAPYPGPPSLVGDRDACGVGFLADQKGRRRHDIMARALVALGCMEHRGGCGGDQKGECTAGHGFPCSKQVSCLRGLRPGTWFQPAPLSVAPA